MPSSTLTPQQAARNQLVEEHLHIAHDVAWGMVRRSGNAVDFSDVVGHAYLGLIDAAEKYDPAEGTFKTYAYHRCRGAMIDGLRSLDDAPRSRRSKERHARDAKAKLEVKYGREVDTAEVAAELGVTFDEAQSALVRHGADVMAHDDMERLNVEDSTSVQDMVEDAELLTVLAAAVRRLPDRYRTVVEMCVIDGATLAEAADALGVTESRACQIRGAAIDALRTALSHLGAAAPKSTSTAYGRSGVVKHLAESFSRAPLRRRAIYGGRVVASQLVMDESEGGDIHLDEREPVAA